MTRVQGLRGKPALRRTTRAFATSANPAIARHRAEPSRGAGRRTRKIHRHLERRRSVGAGLSCAAGAAARDRPDEGSGVLRSRDHGRGRTNRWSSEPRGTANGSGGPAFPKATSPIRRIRAAAERRSACDGRAVSSGGAFARSPCTAMLRARTTSGSRR